MKLSKIKKQITKGKIAIEHTDLESLTKVLKHFYPEVFTSTSGFLKYYFSNYGNKKMWTDNNHFAGKSFKDVDLLKFIEYKQKIIMELSKIKKVLQNGTIAIEHTDLESLKKVIKYFYPEDDHSYSGFFKYYYSLIRFGKIIWMGSNHCAGKSFKDVDLLKYIEYEGKIMNLPKIKKQITKGKIAIEHTDLESLTKVLKYFYPEVFTSTSGSSKYYFSNHKNKKMWTFNNHFEGKSFKDVDLLKLIESK